MVLAFLGRHDAYGASMEDAAPHVLLKIDTAKPVELGDFVSLFVAIGNQYERFVGGQDAEDRTDARFYVKEIRPGCIEAELIGFAAIAGPILGGGLAAIKYANDIQKFVENFGGRVSRYFKPGGRDETASKVGSRRLSQSGGSDRQGQ